MRFWRNLKVRSGIIVDGGIPKIGIASTVVRVNNGEINILREGPIKEKDILKIANE